VTMQVENRIVGAPCGVMDQMTSACGEANKLLAMICQVSKGTQLLEEVATRPSHSSVQLCISSIIN
jgi:galactokinase